MSGLLDRLHLFVLRLQARERERRRRRWQGGASPSGPPRVFYGNDCLPGRSEVAAGGIVKCQDLMSLYPNVPDRPNIVYLVSSALPLHAGYLGRRARKAGAKLVLNQNGVAYPAWHGPGWERANRPLRQIVLEADHVFFQSTFCRLAAERFLGKREGPWEVLYNPVDTRVFTPPRERSPGEAPILLCAGSHHGFYRVRVAIETLAQVIKEVPGARLILAGRYLWQASESASLDEVRQCAGQLGVEHLVEVQGPYTQEQAPALFRRAHVLIHSKYADPCPRVVVEAMACGLPVAYSATGGVPELVGADAGIGVPGPVDWERDHPPSSREMAAAVVSILGAYEQYSAASRMRAVAGFDVAPWIGRHREVFERLSGGAGARSW